MYDFSTPISISRLSRPLVLSLGLALLSACGGDGDDSRADASRPDTDAENDAGQSNDRDQAAAESERSSAGCKNASISAGDHDSTLDFGGKSRAYTVHVPSSAAKAPAPLVINLHGFLSNNREQAVLTHMSSLADSEGFVVAYPNGAGDPTAWNAGDCCEFKERDRDDAGFIEALIDQIAASTCIDLSRVYVTGFSNGGFLAHELGCKLSHRLGAIATVAGVLGMPADSCKPKRALPVLQIHGDADPTVPYQGGSPGGWELLYPGQAAPTFGSVQATAEAWRDKNGCTTSKMQGFMQGDASCESYKGCRDGSEVTLCTISGGGHSWPGGDPSAFKGTVAGLPISGFLGKTSTSLDASAQIWDFFKRHPLP